MISKKGRICNAPLVIVQPSRMLMYNIGSDGISTNIQMRNNTEAGIRHLQEGTVVGPAKFVSLRMCEKYARSRTQQEWFQAMSASSLQAKQEH